MVAEKDKRPLLIFDCGDTLVRLYPSKEKIVCDFLKRKNILVPRKEIAITFRILDYCYRQTNKIQKSKITKKNFMLFYNSKLFGALGLFRKKDRWARELFVYFNRRKNWRLYPDVMYSLSSLIKNGFRLGVAANWDNSLPRVLKCLGIFDIFDFIFSSTALKVEKPDGRFFNLVLKKTKTEKYGNNKNIFYVGNDYYLDGEAAYRAGLKPIIIDRKKIYFSRDYLKFLSLLSMRNFLIRRFVKI